MPLTNTYDGTRDSVGTAFTITNLTASVSMQCDNVADNAIADVLGTLIRELIAKGIVAGTITTH